MATILAKVQEVCEAVAGQAGKRSHDIGSLFSRFRESPLMHYQELKRQQSAQAVLDRWPLLSELQRDDLPPGDK